jgi:hypothetical protein
MEELSVTAGQLVIGLISIIVSFIPIGTLIWKFSKTAFQVDANKNDIISLSEKLTRRLDKTDERFVENEAKLSNIEITMGRLEEKMNILLTRIK